MAKINIIDTTLRDGMHSVAHQYTLDQVRDIAAALEAAGAYAVEVSHGDGLGGSSIQYGYGRHSDEEYLEAAAQVLEKTRLAVLLLPGIGLKEDLEMAYRCGARVSRVATHVTEADIAEQHIGLSKKLGMESANFLMMAHMVPLDVMLHNAKLMESYGADLVYVVDSAGYMLPGEVGERVKAMKDHLGCKVGFHAHNNLGLAMANVLAAVDAGADYLDGSLSGMGGGGGNASTEMLAAVLERSGIDSGLDLYKTTDAAEIAAPIKRQAKEDTSAQLMLGYAGVYSSFMLHANRAANRFNVDARDILVELGKRRVVGGQEDMIIDVAHELAQAR
ncbi:MAG: 4-hydroxy-2-oxovalerate aldolase [Desulfobacterales bacterium]|nr:4-hydroxy-2-oxovalerate aldolase [Desulfobacterales bacterium]